jgi:sugar (glycoside-pentoside-hexuronide) transporter
VSQEPVAVPSLSFGTKLGYGVGNLGLQCVTSATVAYLLFYYSDVLKLAPVLVGVAITLPRFWDAISDPMMGVISDRTRLAGGRRRPYIFWGAPLLALSFVLLWYPFASGSAVMLFTYLLLANLFFTTMITVVGVPYTSLGGELSPQYHERTTVFAFSQGFGMLGGLLGMAMLNLAALVPEAMARFSYIIIAILIGIPSCVFLWATYLATRETAPREGAVERPRLRVMLKANLRNRAFRNLALTVVVANAGMMLSTQFLPFMLKYWVRLDHLLFYAYAAYTLSVYLGFPLWKKIGERKDKKHVLAVGFAAAGTVYALSFFMFQPGDVVLLFAWAILVGMCGAAGILFPFSMIADIADEDELETGHRSEGVFYGAFSFIQKCSLALGTIVSSLALSLAGFEAGVEPSAGTLLVFRLVYVIPAVSFLFASVLIYRGYPLTRERAAAVKQALNERAGSAA